MITLNEFVEKMNFYGDRLDEAGFIAAGSPASSAKLRRMEKNDPNDDDSYNTPEELEAIKKATQAQFAASAKRRAAEKEAKEARLKANPNGPHAVHINGKPWKEFATKAHAENVAKKIPGAMAHPV